MLTYKAASDPTVTGSVFMPRFRLSLGQGRDADYLWDSAEMQIIFGTGAEMQIIFGTVAEMQITFRTMGRFRLSLGQCGDADYLWDSAEM